MRVLKQSTASQIIKLGPFLDSTDGDTEETGLTIANTDIKISKAGGTYANKNSGGGTHDADGFYTVTLDATDTNTVGRIQIYCHMSGALMVTYDAWVVEEAIYDALFGSSANGFDSNGRVDLGLWLGTAPLALSSQRIQSHLGGGDSGVITAALIAADAIGASELATDAVQEIRDAITGGAYALDTDANGRIRLVDGTGAGEIDLTSGLIAGIAGTKNTLDDLNDLSAAQVNAEADTALSDYDPPTLDEVVGLLQLLARSDSAIATDRSSLLTLLNANEGTGAGSFDNTTDAEQALRDRGDSAWITGGGGGITQILNVSPVIPNDIDLAGTSTVRIGLVLINSVDDLPSTAEITPGTITIERKAIGGTSWSAIVTDAAMSEQAGMVYYDEVFDSGSGYAEGDSIRITFKSVSITADTNTHEICDANGVIFQTSIRQTMRGTNSAALASDWTSSRAGYLDNLNVGETLPTQADITGGAYALDSDANGRMRVVDGTGAGEISLTNGLIDWNAAWDAEVQSEVADALAAFWTSPSNLVDLIWNESAASHPVDGTTGYILDNIGSIPTVTEIRVEMDNNSTQLAAILADSNELQGDWANGGRLDLLIDAILADSNELQSDWADGGRLDLLLDALPSQSDITGGAYSLDTDANGRMRIVDGTGAGELDTSNGLIAGISGTKNTFDDLNDIDSSDILTTQLTESYAANGVAPTLVQALFAIHQKLMQHAYSGTNSNTYQLDNSSLAFVGTLDDGTNPTEDRRVAA